MNEENNNTPKKKNYTAVIIIVIVVILLFIGLLITGGVVIYNNFVKPKITTVNKTKDVIDDVNDTIDKIKKDVTEKIDAKESNSDSPLKVGQWGYASKYAGKYLDEEYADKTYIDVPVRVTKISRGNKLSDEVTELLASKHYKANDPKKTLEWAIVEYEVDLTDVKFGGTLGTTIKIDSSIKGKDGGSVKYDDITYIGLTTIDVSSSDYVKEAGVYKGKFVTQLPIGCKDYLIKLGNSYNGAESFFKGE